MTQGESSTSSGEASVDFNFGTGEVGGNPATPTQQAPAQQQAPTQQSAPPPVRQQAADRPSWLEDMFSGLPEDQRAALDELEPEPDPNEPESNEPDPENPLGLPKELIEFVKAGGKPEDFYRQQAAPPQQQAQEEQPAAPPKSALLQRQEAIDTEITAKKNEYRELQKKHRTMITQGYGDDVLDAIEEQMADLTVEITGMVNRKQYIASQVESEQITGLQSTYEGEFVSRMVEDHGLTRPQAEKIKGNILKDERIAAMMGRADTRELLQMDLVRDVFVKAALYDLQFASKRKRQAPTDPAVRGGRNNAAPAPTRTTAGNPIPENDRGFSDFMTGRSDKQ